MNASGPDFDAIVATEPVAAAAPTWRVGTRLDEWWAGRTSRTRTLLRWSAPVAVMATAILTRFVGLGHPPEIVFDETYYVKDAWTTWNLGFEGTWPGDPTGADPYWANKQFAAGQTDLFTGEGSFAVHPPLGKWIIALGMALLGPSNPSGWRLSVAVFGVLLVTLIMLVAHQLTRSMLVAAFAGGLLAIDGNGIVMSRIGLLDGFVAFFALLAFYFVLLDRARTDRTGALWARPWLLAAGAALGACTAVKWSGLWFIAFFGVWVVISDVWGRRVERIPAPRRSAWDLLKRGPVDFLLLVPIALAVYLVTWTGWFTTDGGYYRNWADEGDHAWTGAFAWVPHSVQSFLHQQGEVLRFHEGLRADHPYKSPAWAWLVLARPTAMWYEASAPGDPSCTSPSGLCGSLISDLPNPLIWFAAVAALIWLIVVVIRRRDRVAAAILIGFGAGFLPWLLFPDRPTYFFYSIAFQPFLILALAVALHRILGSPQDERSRRRSGIIAVSVFLAVAVALSAFFLPIWTGMSVDIGYLQAHYWVPGWV